MKYEKLNLDNGNKKFLYGLIMGVLLIIIINLIFSYAKYKSVDSVKLASGTINYESADLNVIAMYKNDGDGQEDVPIEAIPKGNYGIDNNKSYCIIGSNKNDKIKNVFEYKENKVYIAIEQKGTKCYVYFEKQKTPAEQTLANLGFKDLGEISNFDGTACSSDSESDCTFKEENGVYHADDDYGTSYYFRGTVGNNWVKFGKKGDNDIYWRIIRINGNGTIRLIYSGEQDSYGNSNTGKNAVDGKAYNEEYEDNKYLGFMYGGSKGSFSSSYENAHTNTTKSDILRGLETWWQSTNLDSLLAKIDGETGFCNDRQPYDGSSASSQPDKTNTKGYAKVVTYYGTYIRATQTRKPTLKCAQLEKDLFTLKGQKGKGNGALEKPVGVITSEEVMYAGGYYNKENKGYWLYTNQYYWTMSPWYFNGNCAYVFFVTASGNLDFHDVFSPTIGARPVINLKANLTFTGNGTTDSPFEISE